MSRAELLNKAVAGQLLLDSDDAQSLAKSLPHLMGIDEAGRGPVLGSMVYGGCWCPIVRKEALSAMGFDDSKKLSEGQREKFFQQIKQSDFIGYKVDVISPQVLSGAMLRRIKYNLNAISHDSAIGLIQHALDSGVNVAEVYVDTVGPPESYEAKLSARFPTIKCVVRKKADSLFPIVSAASICAKVTRDHDLANWVFEEKNGGTFSRDFGSGYPGDAKAKQWLADCFDPVCGFPSLVRFSWATAREFIKEHGVPVAWEDDDEEDAGEEEGAKRQKTTQKLAAFLVTGSSRQDMMNRIPLQKRHSYFRDLRLDVATDFS